MTVPALKSGQLFFYEEIMLLALRDDDGKIENKAQFSYKHLLAGTLLAELVMLDRIKIDRGKKLLVELASSTLTGNLLLDEAITKISESKKPRGAQHWIGAFQRISNFFGKAAQSLCNRGILAAEEGKAFLFFDKTYYPELNPKPEQELLSRLKAAIFTDNPAIDERTLVLLALLRKSDLLKIPFDAKALRDRRHHMKDLCEGNLVGDATHKAVEAAQTAVMMAAIMPAITTATMVH